MRISQRISAIFQCFLTAKYPIIPATIKPTGIISTPTSFIFNFLHFFNIDIKPIVCNKDRDRYNYKHNSKHITISAIFSKETYSICTKATCYCYKYYKLFIQSIYNLRNCINSIFTQNTTLIHSQRSK